MQQKMLFLFGEFDNQLRKEKCMAGTKEMLLRGDWPTMPPLGYEILRVDGQRKIVINAKGKLLKLAFSWKAEGMSSESIRVRLAERGLKIYAQHLSTIFRNPFYCGMMVHNLLEGKVVPGNHEKMISQDLFLRVNGVLAKNAQGYKFKEDNDDIPLKHFLHCDKCGKPLSGYIVHKKNLYYYKCRTIGCGNNKSAASLHDRFEKILEYFSIDPDLDAVEAIKDQAVITFNRLTKGYKDEQQLLYKDLSDLDKKIERLEERYINEEIKADLYNKYSQKYGGERREIEKRLSGAPKKSSNLEKYVDWTLKIALKLAPAWRLADYRTKQNL